MAVDALEIGNAPVQIDAATEVASGLKIPAGVPGDSPGTGLAADISMKAIREYVLSNPDSADSIAQLIASAGGLTTASIAGLEDQLEHASGYNASGKQYKIVACVIRQDTQGSGWYVIDDDSHKPLGLDAENPVEISNGSIRLNYSFTAKTVTSLVCAPDEGYASQLLQFGASVGRSSSFIDLYHPFYIRISGTAAVTHSYFGDRGVDWDVVHDTAAGTWTITHPTQSHSDNAGSIINVEKFGSDSNSTDYVTSDRSKSSFTIEARQTIHGKTHGLNILSENAGPQTLSWDGVSTLTIAHPSSTSLHGVQVCSLNPRYHAAVVSATKATIDVQFYDISTGALYTGSGIPSYVYYSRAGSAATPISGGSNFKAERSGMSKLDPANVAGASSNIWVYGIFEVSTDPDAP